MTKYRKLFWGEQFENPEEETIWEELKQMLTNPPSEQEIALKKQKEQEWIDSILNKAFPDEPKIKEEPYLTPKELGFEIPDKKIYAETDYGKSKSLQNNSLLEGKISSYQNPYDEVQNNPNLSKEEKVAKIKEISDGIEAQINREHMINQAKNYGGAALEIGSAAVPGYGGAKLAQTITKHLSQRVGRKIAKEIATGTLKGASTGTVEGLGRGLLEDENPIKTAVQDTVAGGVLGAGLGTTGGNVQKVVKKKNLKKYDKLLKDRKINKQERKEFINAGNKYYQNYEQGVNTNVKDLGNIKLPSEGLKETITQKPEHIIDVIDLSKNLKNSKVLEPESPKHSHKYNINKFHHLKGKNVDYQIAENQKGDKYFYKITDPYLTGPKPEGEGLLSTPKSTNNIIQPSPDNLNPSQKAIQKPISHNEWLEELKRKRKKLSWW